MRKYVVGAVLLSASLTSQADNGFYVGFNAGQATYDVSLEDLSFLDDGSLTSASLDDIHASLGLSLGYQITSNFSVEASYVELGKISARAESDGSGFLYAPGVVNAKAEASGLAFDIKGQAPINKILGFYGKLGIFSWDADTTLKDSSGELANVSEDESDSFFGLGASFVMNYNSSLNLEYTAYKLDDIDVDVLTIGIQFRL